MDEGKEFIEWMLWALLFGAIIAAVLWAAMVKH